MTEDFLIANELKSVKDGIPARLKQKIRVAGAVLALLGLLPAINLFCVAPLMVIDDSPPDTGDRHIGGRRIGFLSCQFITARKSFQTVAIAVDAVSDEYFHCSVDHRHICQHV